MGIKEKANIIVTKNGVPRGYIKSVSYKTGSFKITKERMYAKGYATNDTIQHDIDFLTKYNYHKGYIFLYN